MKPENTPLYVNYDSNHPPSLLRGLPDAISKTLSNTSSDRRSFDSAHPPYKEALKKAVSIITSITNLDQPHKLNVIRFNPPYSVNVATNIDHKFLQTT